jgi:hypothetical protein
MAQKRKGGVSEETFDEFLAGQGILGACEDHAVKELIAEQLAAAMEAQGLTKGALRITPSWRRSAGVDRRARLAHERDGPFEGAFSFAQSLILPRFSTS